MFSTALKISCIKHVSENAVSYVFIVSLEENSLTTAWNDENLSYGLSLLSFIEVVKRKHSSLEGPHI